VHALQSREGGAQRVALYILHYGTDYVEDPIRFQLRTSFELLFSRRKPMTLFFAAENVYAERPLESTKAAVILLAAVDAFEKARH
jgi:hypothetical protein